MSAPWTDKEQLAVIALYDQMHSFVMAGIPYNKAQMIRDSQDHEVCEVDHDYSGELDTRSKGSIEMKLMNVTAACEALGRPDLSMAEHGYRPMKNMQKSLKDAVEVWLAFEPYRGPIYDKDANTA